MLARTLAESEWIQIERELASRSLAEFVKMAWHVLEPATPYVHGWHIDAIAEHLEAVTYGQIIRLLANVPPGTMKSLLTCVFWPAWEWGPKGLDHNRIIGASHEQSVATRDNLKMRRLITSDWYRERWPVRLTSDQNQKTYFENEKTGFRESCPVKSMTGKRGHRVIWDDPHSVEGGLSVLDRATAIRVFKETLPSRVVDPQTSAIVIIMQRLHEADVSGEALSGDYGYEHLMLPMEFESKHPHPCKTSIGFTDPRTKEGELLFPERFPAEVVERDKKAMGSYATAGQFQQRPAPRTDGFFEWDKLEIVRAAPRLKRIVRYWDKAGTQDGGKFTAGVKMGVGFDDLFYVLDVVRGQWRSSKRERIIKQTADADGQEVEVWVEQEPGSGGKESAENTVLRLAGKVVKIERVTGDKEVRAEPYSVQVEAGNVRLVEGDWNKAFIDEHKVFPMGKFKDQIDAAGGAFNKLAKDSPAGILVKSRNR